MARQALSSIGGWVARLDDEAAARRHAASAGPELVAARRMLAELDRWRVAFGREVRLSLSAVHLGQELLVLLGHPLEQGQQLPLGLDQAVEGGTDLG